jgi:flagellar hook-associated protein 1
LSEAADSRRQSVNGVSLDEEMTNMIRFQRGYQASSRALSTLDEMLDQLINRTGKVGL